MNDSIKVDVHAARKYMKDYVEPVMTDIVEKLAIEQPENVLDFIIDYATKRKNNTTLSHDEEKVAKSEENEVCCFSGFPAECKVKFPNGEIKFYSQDSYEVLKRKGKLRGCVYCLLDEEFPMEDEPHPSDIQIEPFAENAPTPEELDNRPVTPPKRGFKMNGPGQNFHNDTTGTDPSKPAQYVSFEPRALGSISETDGESKAPESKEELREKALEAVEKRKTNVDNRTGIDHLFSEEKREELAEKRKRDEMMGTISAYYQSMGGGAPFGLAAASSEALQRHYEKCKSAMAKHIKQTDETKESTDKEKLVAAKLFNKSQTTNVSKAPRSFAFEPRAFGKTDESESPYQAPESADERRKLAAQAAAARFTQAS